MTASTTFAELKRTLEGERRSAEEYRCMAQKNPARAQEFNDCAALAHHKAEETETLIRTLCEERNVRPEIVLGERHV